MQNKNDKEWILCFKWKRKSFFESKINPGDFYIGHPLIPHGIDIQGSASSFDPLNSNGRGGVYFSQLIRCLITNLLGIQKILKFRL